MKNLEFLNKNDGGVVIVSENDSHILTENDTALVDELFDAIAECYTVAFNALCTLYAKSEPNRRHHRYLIVSRFLRCNFGKYDTKDWDIDADGQMSMEQVDCPMRGECPYQNVICNAKRNTRLSAREEEVLGLLSKGMTAVEVAEVLFISERTVENHARNIIHRLQVRNIREAIDKVINHK